MGWIKDKNHFENYIKKAISINYDKLDFKEILPIDDYVNNIYNKNFTNDYTYQLRENPKLLEDYYLREYLNSKREIGKYEYEKNKTSKDFKNFVFELAGKPGVYLFEDSKERPLYIGVSVDLNDRIQASYNERFSRGQFGKSPIYLKVCKTVNKTDAYILEIYFITTLRPLLNILTKFEEQTTFELNNIPNFSNKILCNNING